MNEINRPLDDEGRDFSGWLFLACAVAVGAMLVSGVGGVMTNLELILLAFLVFQTMTILRLLWRLQNADFWCYSLADENHTLRLELDEERRRAACRGGRVVDAQTLAN